MLYRDSGLRLRAGEAVESAPARAPEVGAGARAGLYAGAVAASCVLLFGLFRKIQLAADCVEEGMLAYNGRDWRSFV